MEGKTQDLAVLMVEALEEAKLRGLDIQSLTVVHEEAVIVVSEEDAQQLLALLAEQGVYTSIVGGNDVPSIRGCVAARAATADPH